MKAPYLMAVNPMEVIATAMSRARVSEVLPVRYGSLMAAEKQNLDFSRINPRQLPISQ